MFTYQISCLFMFILTFYLSRYNYPHHKIDRDVWWYYMIELSFYWSLCISQFYDVKRKDFWEMFIHHVTTIALMAFSWTCNLTRVGTLVLVIHDCADIFLEVTHPLPEIFFFLVKSLRQFFLSVPLTIKTIFAKVMI